MKSTIFAKSYMPASEKYIVFLVSKMSLSDMC